VGRTRSSFSVCGLALAAVLISLVGSSSASAATDFAATARNVIPSGQFGSLNVPPGADGQALMYDSLTPLFGNVDDAALMSAFKPEAFGLTSEDLPATAETVPRPGVAIIRDRFHVPHITAATRGDITWAAGWVAAEDRGLLINQARYDARVAALDVPGLSAFKLVTGLRTFTPSAATESFLAAQAAALGGTPRGQQLLADIDSYAQGLNDYNAAHGITVPAFGRNDVIAVMALVGELFGRGGGNEAATTDFFNGLQHRFGRTRGFKVFNDLREMNDPATPVTIAARFPYERPVAGLGGNVIIDNGSYKPTPAVNVPQARASVTPAHASNFLIVGAQRSATGHPLFVGGPQIGYFYPGLTFEMDLHGGGIDARGATAPGFPGYILIGRGADFAWSLTSAGSDQTDSYAERLCGGSRTKYMYLGKCRSMQRFDAGVLKGSPDQPVRFEVTVHGPVIGYAKVHGRLVAIARKRASYGHDGEFLLPFQQLSDGTVNSPQSFISAMSTSPFTFNAGYADASHIAMFSAGLLPIRPANVDPGLLTDGTGGHEWKGFLPASAHPQAIDPPSGELVNWNNKPAAGFSAADDQWAFGSIMRVQMLLDNLNSQPTQTLAGVVGAMNKAATQDLRDLKLVPDLAAVLGQSKPPKPRDRQMMSLLTTWGSNGASVLDRNLDGKVDDPGAAIMDALGPLLGKAVLEPVLGKKLAKQLDTTILPSDAGTRSDFFGGWNSYVDKDLRTLMKMPVTGRFSVRFCGNGKLAACRRALWKAIDGAGNTLAKAQGPDPTAWRANANAERIHFAPGLLPTTIRYTNRPSGIQQVITFNGHR
jgi:acyl-homoserine lactone acylase PvdQ